MTQRLSAILIGCLLGGCASIVVGPKTTELETLKAGAYELDPDHTTVLFKVSHFGLSDYVGRFNQVRASLDYDEAQPQAAELDVRIDVASIDVNNEEFEQTLCGEAWFACEQHGEARFLLRELVPGPETSVLRGDLTLKGVTAPIELSGQLVGAAQNRLTGRYTLGVYAEGTFARKTFGVSRFGGLIGDNVKIEIYAEFQRRP